MMHVFAARATAICWILWISASPAFAWGLRGHEIIGQAAIAHLPASLPAWVRSNAAKSEIVYLQSEEDRLKVGRDEEAAWYREWSTDHYIDVGDDGRIAGTFSLDALPATRDDYLEALYRSEPPVDGYTIGFLPYAILEGYEQVRTDFALERFAEDALSGATGDARSAAQTELDRRRELTIHDIGVFGHFVGAGSQPLHISVHYNGWGDFPNPNGYTNANTTHASYEDDFVLKFLTPALVTPLVGTTPVFGAVPLSNIEQYLGATLHEVVPFYQLQKRGAFDLDGASPAHDEGVRFTAARLAAAAQMLDSLVLTAYQTSGTIKPYRGQ